MNIKNIRKPSPILFTPAGFEKVQKEQVELLEKRKTAVKNLQTAREMGDLSENGAYKAARFELTSLDRRLRELARFIRFGKIVQSQNNGVVDIGSTVTIFDGKNRNEYSIVGGYESNPMQKKLSHISPVGRALLGKRKGDSVTVQIPTGTVIYTIEKVS